MALRPDEEVAFTEDDLTHVVEILGRLSADGAGWVNFSPEVEAGSDPPPRSLVATVFSARGEAVPLATWTAPEKPGARATVGIEHGAGPKALDHLAATRLPLGPGWVRLSDHPRRGLVVAVPADADLGDVLWWLLAASHALSTVPLTGAWLASVHRG